MGGGEAGDSRWFGRCSLLLCLASVSTWPGPAGAETQAWRVPSWSLQALAEPADSLAFFGQLTEVVGPSVLCTPAESDSHTVVLLSSDGRLESSWKITLPAGVRAWHGMRHLGRPILLAEDHTDSMRVTRTLFAASPGSASIDTLASRLRSVEILRADVWRVSSEDPALEPEIWTERSRIQIRETDTIAVSDTSLFRTTFTTGTPGRSSNLRMEELDFDGRSIRTRDVVVVGVALNRFLDATGAVWRQRTSLVDVESTRLIVAPWNGRSSSIPLPGLANIVDVSGRWIVLSKAASRRALSYTVRNRSELGEVRRFRPPIGLVGSPILWRDSLLSVGLRRPVGPDDSPSGESVFMLAEFALDGSPRAEFHGQRADVEPGAIWMTTGISPAPLRREADWLFVDSPYFELVGFDLRQLRVDRGR